MAGKVALITGAARGLGKAYSQALLQKGGYVCIADVETEKGMQLADALNKEHGKGKAVFVQCDATKSSDLENAFETAKSTFNKLDIVCNNAGILDEQNYRKMIEINLVAVIEGTRLGIHHMSKNNGGEGGVIINVASMAGIWPMPFGPAYTASKHAVVGLSRAYAAQKERKTDNIRVNCLCPAFARTSILNVTEESVADFAQAQKYVETLGVIEPNAVAEGFMELVENEEKNGAVLMVANSFGTKYMKYPEAML